MTSPAAGYKNNWLNHHLWESEIVVNISELIFQISIVVCIRAIKNYLLIPELLNKEITDSSLNVSINDTMLS